MALHWYLEERDSTQDDVHLSACMLILLIKTVSNLAAVKYYVNT